MDEEALEKLAEDAYNAYGRSVSWQAVSGTRMPAWEELPLRVMQAWKAAADAVVSAYEGK